MLTLLRDTPEVRRLAALAKKILDNQKAAPDSADTAPTQPAEKEQVA